MGELLERVKCPGDLQEFSAQELEQLAQEIREQLIETIAVTGGHLAPNLGVVELTLAMHLVFSTPQDKIVWDVGHQSYVHKLLTGRLERFCTLRQHNGIAGFPKRSESIHDTINTGHSSTSISAALGLAFARDLQNQKGAVITVIGDGALTGGVALEALNHAGNVKTDMIVVLNDNEKSIADNVGALSTYLTRMRTDPRYFRSKEDVEETLRRIPTIGPQVLKVLERVKEGLKHIVVPGLLFEELGYAYLGPIDGHNLEELRSVMQRARKIRGPVLIHVLTKKGKGYGPAEANPSAFHGVGPFDIATGKVHKTEGPKSYTQVFGETLMTLARQDEKIVAITAAMPDGTGLTPFAKAFPARFFDVGIAEQHAVTMASAMALEGLKPVTAIYSTFMQRAYDQVFHDVCLQKAPVVLAIDRGGVVGEDGETHHGLFDFAYLRHIPEIVVMAPKDENELQHMIYTAVEYPGPIAVRYPRGSGLGVPLDQKLERLPIGKAEVLRHGQDVALIAIGSMVAVAQEAAELLLQEGIQATVVNARFVKPLDEATLLNVAQKVGRIVTIEEHALAGGFGSAVLELLEDHGVACAVKRIGVPDEFVQHGASSILRKELGLTAQNVAREAQKLAGTTQKLVDSETAAVCYATPRKGNLAAVKIAFRGDKR